MEFTPLHFPKANLKLSRKEGIVYVWDTLRRKNLVCTPEEWVRQHVISYLILQKNYPNGLIASEHPIEVNNLKRRCDIVIFNRNQHPVLMVECKAPEIKLSENTFHQIAQYNFKMNVKYLVMTNGIQTITCYVDHENNRLQYLEEIPSFSEIL